MSGDRRQNLSRKHGSMQLRSATPTLTALGAASPNPRLPWRHTQRIRATQGRETSRTIYFEPESFRASGVAFGPAMSCPQSIPQRCSDHEAAEYDPEQDNVEHDTKTNVGSTTYASQIEMDYLVKQLAEQQCDQRPRARSSTDSHLQNPIPNASDSPTRERTIHFGSTCSNSIPSLTAGSSRSSLGSLPGTSFPNHTGTIEQIKRQSVTPCPSYVGANAQSRSSYYGGPYLPLPPLFTSVALTDSKVAGQPIRFTSSTFEPGTNALRVGSCTFLNLPYGSDTECGLRIEPLPVTGHWRGMSRGLGNPHQHIKLQIVQRIVHAGTGRQASLLCAETNVTEGFTPDVRAELATRAAKLQLPVPVPEARLETLEMLPSTIYNPFASETLVETDSKHMAALSAAKDCHLRGQTDLDDMDAQCSVKPMTGASQATNSRIDDEVHEDIWLNIAKSLTYNNPSSTSLPALPQPLQQSSPALQDLLSLLDEIKLLHRNFFVIRMRIPTPASSDYSCKQHSVPFRFSIPWLSTQLFQTLFNIHARLNPTKAEAERPTPDANVLAIFKDAMAVQLSSSISPAPYTKSSRAANGADHIFREVTLPSMLTAGWRGQSNNSEDQVGCMLPEQMGAYMVPMFDDALGIGQQKGKEEVKCWTCFLVESAMEGLC